MLDRQKPEPRHPTLAASVVAAIQGRIDSRSLAPGARLPWVGGLA
jgi:DNA-binding FadR family transcriptional regulator